MARQFECPNCGELIVTYLHTGGIAACPHCGRGAQVPEDARETDAEPAVLSSPASMPRPALPRYQPTRIEKLPPWKRMRLWGRVNVAVGVFVLVLPVLLQMVGASSLEWKEVGLRLLLPPPIPAIVGALLWSAGLILVALAEINRAQSGSR